MPIRLKILPVFQGDSIVVNCFYEGEIAENIKILVDTGTKRAYARGILKSELEQTEKFDLLVITHTDEDHIGGLLKYFEDADRKISVFKEIWFNGMDVIRGALIISEIPVNEILINQGNNLTVSVNQGISLEKKLKDEGLYPTELIKSGSVYSISSTNIIVVSPEIDDLSNYYEVFGLETEDQLEISKKCDHSNSIEDLLKVKFTENGSLVNKTSIGFILKYRENSILLMGDAYPSVIEKNLRKMSFNESNKLKLDAVKVSHHGSNYGISATLLDIIDCNKFIISTNGSNGLPTKECLARIVAHRDEKVSIYFNYKNEITENIFCEKDLETYNFEVSFLTIENDFTIEIGE